MPQVSQEDYDRLQKMDAGKARKATLKKAQQAILKSHQDEVDAEVTRLNA